LVACLEGVGVEVAGSTVFVVQEETVPWVEDFADEEEEPFFTETEGSLVFRRFLRIGREASLRVAAHL